MELRQSDAQPREWRWRKHGKLPVEVASYEKLTNLPGLVEHQIYLDGQSTAKDSTVFTGFRWENRFRQSPGFAVLGRSAPRFQFGAKNNDIKLVELRSLCDTRCVFLIRTIPEGSGCDVRIVWLPCFSNAGLEFLVCVLHRFIQGRMKRDRSIGAVCEEFRLHLSDRALERADFTLFFVDNQNLAITAPDLNLWPIEDSV